MTCTTSTRTNYATGTVTTFLADKGLTSKRPETGTGRIGSYFSTVSTISVPIPSSHFPLRWGWYSVPRARRPEHVTLPSRRSRIGGTRYYQSLLDSGRFENRAALARYRGVSWAKVTQVLRRHLACLCQP